MLVSPIHVITVALVLQCTIPCTHVNVQLDVMVVIVKHVSAAVRFAVKMAVNVLLIRTALIIAHVLTAIRELFVNNVK